MQGTNLYYNEVPIDITIGSLIEGFSDIQKPNDERDASKGVRIGSDYAAGLGVPSVEKREKRVCAAPECRTVLRPTRRHGDAYCSLHESVAA